MIFAIGEVLASSFPSFDLIPKLTGRPEVVLKRCPKKIGLRLREGLVAFPCLHSLPDLESIDRTLMSPK